MNEAKAKQYLADFHAEVKRVALGYALTNYIGGGRKIVSGQDVTARYCTVLGVRMAKIWCVTNGTANRRLQALAEHGVIRDPRYGASHCDSYHLAEDEAIKYVHEAIEHWKSVGYSQTEILHDSGYGDLAPDDATVRISDVMDLPLGTVVTCEKGVRHVYVGKVKNTAGYNFVFMPDVAVYGESGMHYRCAYVSTALRKFPDLARFVPKISKGETDIPA